MRLDEFSAQSDADRATASPVPRAFAIQNKRGRETRTHSVLPRDQ
jgi:hypothetical protein